MIEFPGLDPDRCTVEADFLGGEVTGNGGVFSDN